MAKGDYDVVMKSDNDLEFQDFTDSTSNFDSTANTSKPTANSTSNTDNQGFTNASFFGQPTQNEPPKKVSVWSVDFYAPYFNIDTIQVAKRMLESVIPFKTNFISDIDDSPDLYGPFWIPTTVIFAIFVTSSLSESIVAYISDQPHMYDFNLLWFSAVTVYVYVTVVPAIFWILTKWLGCQPSLLEILNVYGYALSIWIPISVVCIIPNEVVRWSLVGAGFGTSGFFMCRSMYKVISRSERFFPKLLILFILAAHAALAFVFKFKFYSYTINFKVIRDMTDNILDSAQ
ncbi:Yip1-domain-containing protein [Basidiobolus meristosporus CBS 931.73]|uniref:Protein YIP n=1 Tax=Basidiobolus meristosporus CBS 931.73 TaxID=1314790 RepID=A0A1Y1XMY3_9FUNG|nr:Yip1-domain-containing protein [Basidiobolus meristosporus CBS 931.73]|eukprot:ORX87098.1 Yip1-domain-containing protein [Basidiobolus meristosporus CBS 931.73]